MPDDQRLGACALRRGDHRIEIVAGRLEIAAAQPVVAAQLDDDDGRLVPREQRRQPRPSAGRRVAGDAGVDDPVADSVRVAMRAASRSTQPAPAGSPYPAEIESPTTSSTGAPESARADAGMSSATAVRAATRATRRTKAWREGIDNAAERGGEPRL